MITSGRVLKKFTELYRACCCLELTYKKDFDILRLQATAIPSRVQSLHNATKDFGEEGSVDAWRSLCLQGSLLFTKTLVIKELVVSVLFSLKLVEACFKQEAFDAESAFSSARDALPNLDWICNSTLSEVKVTRSTLLSLFQGALESYTEVTSELAIAVLSHLATDLSQDLGLAGSDTPLVKCIPEMIEYIKKLDGPLTKSRLRSELCVLFYSFHMSCEQIEPADQSKTFSIN